ncbi:MAG: AIPR family protein [Bifidobacteriales bacterium]|nr:AIPR family protein [Bifidobacteriales bacterium]
MELVDYRRELVARIQDKAIDESLLDQDAFFQVACEILRDSEAIADYQPIEPGYRFGEGTNRFTAIDGYDQSAFDMDESIVVIVCDDNYSIRIDDALPTIQAKDCQRYINAMRRFIVSSWKGSFQDHAEESTTAYQFARFIYDNRASISRFRLYFITDREYTGRDSTLKDPTDFYSTDDSSHKVSLEAHVWDLRHLMESSEAAAPLEHLTVQLGDEGIPAVKAPNCTDDMDTYLMFLSGQVLADWYKKHGSKLMEANVRSFLSLRGKVNRGIRNTLEKEPDRFVAYNNGLSATASGIEMNADGHITAIRDLQIVNGGQTTASIYYSQKKDGMGLSEVVVPVKLVVVSEAVARDLIPNISRYTNSQNKVAETDFSSNSEYQVRLSQLSQQILTPPLPGKNQTHWYYERTRGQYESEKNRREKAERKSFEKMNPSKQRIKMIDAPKYLMCWAGKPEIASLGSQKCFAKFVSSEAERGKESIEELDADFYKQLVCKRIVFDTVYKHIKTAPWYKGAYQANIAEYAVAKYTLDLRRSHRGFDFDAVWHTQRINDEVLSHLLTAAEQASDVLNDDQRATQNVSEWAKKEACWENLRHKPTCLGEKQEAPTYANSVRFDQSTAVTPSTDGIVGSEASDSGIGQRAIDWLSVSSRDYQALYLFAESHDLLNPRVRGSLENLLEGNQEDVDIDALNSLIYEAGCDGFRFMDTGIEHRTSKTQPSPEDRRSLHRNVPEGQEFLSAIPGSNWRTIIDWGKARNLVDNDILADIAKIDKGIKLSDSQISRLLQFRDQMIELGFPRSHFEPRFFAS